MVDSTGFVALGPDPGVAQAAGASAGPRWARSRAVQLVESIIWAHAVPPLRWMDGIDADNTGPVRTRAVAAGAGTARGRARAQPGVAHPCVAVASGPARCLRHAVGRGNPAHVCAERRPPRRRRL